MTSLVAARFQWVRSFSRRLFTVVDVAATPAALAQLFQDPCARLESQLALVVAEPAAAETAPANTTGFVENPISRGAPPSLPGDQWRGSAATLSGTRSRPGPARRDKPKVFPNVAPATNPFMAQTRPERDFAPEENVRSLHSPPAAARVNNRSGSGRLDDAIAHFGPSAGTRDKAEMTAHRIVPRDVVKDGVRREEKEPTDESRAARVHKAPAPSALAEVPEFSSADAVPELTRLVRGAAGLTGLLRANTPERFFPGSRPQSSGTTRAPVASEPAESNGGMQRTAVSPDAVSGEPSRVPAASPATIDEVLAELHERLHLEYLRTYGASGD